VAEQLAPVDLVVAFEDDVGDVGAVVAMMILDEDLGPDELRRRDQAHRSAEQLGLGGMGEPFVGDRRGDGRHVEDDVDEQFSARDPRQPALVHHLDVVVVLLEIIEHLQRVAGLGEDVDILGRPVDAGVAGERVGA
jgi:hypothetical protein